MPPKSTFLGDGFDKGMEASAVRLQLPSATGHRGAACGPVDLPGLAWPQPVAKAGEGPTQLGRQPLGLIPGPRFRRREALPSSQAQLLGKGAAKQATGTDDPGERFRLSAAQACADCRG